MGCLNKPITIPTGQDGNSVTIAFASDSSGSNFSYTPDSSRPYIAFVSKKGTVSTSDFDNWVKYIGTDGTDGEDGISISNVYVSDGKTAIGGTVYTENSVIILLSNGSYVNAGEISLPTQAWTNLTLVNSWTAVSGYTPQYLISNGWIYLRGALNNSSATSQVFAYLTMGLTNEVRVTISDSDATTPVFSRFIYGPQTAGIPSTIANSLNIVEYSNGNGVWNLDTVAPISIR